jgi:hypothetical protein
LDQKQEQIISALGRQIGTTFIRQSGAYFWSSDHAKRVICTLSKRYTGRSRVYWFGYHPEWHDFLVGQGDGHLVLGCMDLPFAFVIPVGVLAGILGKLKARKIGDRVDHRHLAIIEPSPGSYALAVSASEPFALDQYRLPLE